MKNLKSKSVLITGAASGIGRSAALRLFDEGCHLYLVDLAPLAETELAHQFKERMQYIQADITRQEGIDLINSRLPTELDVLINNAGITRDATVFKMTDEAWDDVISVNLKAVFKMSQLAARKMKPQGFGAIINVASVVAHYGNFGQTNYVVSKAGVIGLTKTLAKELGKYGVRVNAVAPGFIATAMVQKMPEKIIEMMKNKSPLQRLGLPEEIAATFAFLASDEAKFITGTCINVDGGIVI